MRVFWGAYTLWNICVGISRMSQPAEQKYAGQRTEEFITDKNEKLKKKHYTGKADELEED